MSDQMIPVPIADYERMRADMTKAKSAIEAAELENAFRTGGLEGARQAMQGKIAAAEQRAQAETVKSTLRSALAEHPLVPGGVEQLTTILGSQFRAVPAANGLAVVAPDGRDARSYINNLLSQQDWSHFRSDRQPAAPASAPNANNQPAGPPKNAGEFFLQQARANAAAPAQADAATDLSQSFGLPTRGSASPLAHGVIPGLGRLLGR
jgi:hypothetical protein